MTFWDDLDREMLPLPLDGDTADRLLAGRIASEDAPPGYGPVVRLLEAASADPTAEELEDVRISAVVAAVRSLELADSASPRRSLSIPIALSLPRLVAAGLVAALLTTAGLASAGSLPDAAQDIASDMLSRIGVSVPGSDEDVRPRFRTRGNSGGWTELSGVEGGPAAPTMGSGGVSQAERYGAAGPGASADDEAGGSRSDRVKAGKGGEGSEHATSSEPTGRGKGAAVSKAASGGKSKADKGSAGKGKAGKDGAERPGSRSGGNTASPPGKSHDKGAGKGKGSGGAGKAASGQAQRPS